MPEICWDGTKNNQQELEIFFKRILEKNASFTIDNNYLVLYKIIIFERVEALKLNSRDLFNFVGKICLNNIEKTIENVIENPLIDTTVYLKSVNYFVDKIDSKTCTCTSRDLLIYGCRCEYGKKDLENERKNKERT
jgi:hypothetical protein